MCVQLIGQVRHWDFNLRATGQPSKYLKSHNRQVYFIKRPFKGKLKRIEGMPEEIVRQVQRPSKGRDDGGKQGKLRPWGWRKAGSRDV